MMTFLPKEVSEGLERARKKAKRKASRLKIDIGEARLPVVEAWDGGFAVEVEKAGSIRGRVALYEGARLLSYCLIVASEDEGDLRRFEYKILTDAVDQQPLDYVRHKEIPVALLGAS